MGRRGLGAEAADGLRPKTDSTRIVPITADLFPLLQVAFDTAPAVPSFDEWARTTLKADPAKLTKGLCIFNVRELGLIEPRSGVRVKPGADTSSAPGHEITSSSQPRRGIPFRACLLTVSTRTDRIEVAPPGLKPFVMALCLGRARPRPRLYSVAALRLNSLVTPTLGRSKCTAPKCEKTAAQSRYENDAVHRILTLGSHRSNLHRGLEKFIKCLGLTPWDDLFQTLRRSAETDFARTHPQHAVSKWIGHSMAVSERHYLQVTDDLLDTAVNAQWHPLCNPQRQRGSQTRSETRGTPSLTLRVTWHF